MVQFGSARKSPCSISDPARLLTPTRRYFMAKQCAICGKTPQYGHHVSHAKNRVNRRFLPNLQMGRVTVSGKTFRARVCTRCLRTYSG
jgi:large subunit ribosomal protein L28